MASVAICTPHGSLAVPDYYRCVMAMQHQFPQHSFMHVEVDSVVISKARNTLVSAGLSVTADVLWMIDDDTLIPPDAGVLVDQAVQLGVVSGVYFNRRPPFTPQVYKVAEEPEFLGAYWPLLEYPKTGLRKEDAFGAGCICFRPDVFRKLTEYWTPIFKEAGGLLEKSFPSVARIVTNLSPWFEFLERKGEDMYICERIREAGMDLWVNWDVKCAHRASVDIAEEHFTFLRDNNRIVKLETMHE